MLLFLSPMLCASHWKFSSPGSTEKWMHELKCLFLHLSPFLWKVYELKLKKYTQRNNRKKLPKQAKLEAVELMTEVVGLLWSSRVTSKRVAELHYCDSPLFHHNSPALSKNKGVSNCKCVGVYFYSSLLYFRFLLPSCMMFTELPFSGIILPLL